MSKDGFRYVTIRLQTRDDDDAEEKLQRAKEAIQAAFGKGNLEKDSVRRAIESQEIDEVKESQRREATAEHLDAVNDELDREQAIVPIDEDALQSLAKQQVEARIKLLRDTQQHLKELREFLSGCKITAAFVAVVKIGWEAVKFLVGLLG